MEIHWNFYFELRYFFPFFFPSNEWRGHSESVVVNASRDPSVDHPRHSYWLPPKYQVNREQFPMASLSFGHALLHSHRLGMYTRDVISADFLRSRPVFGYSLCHAAPLFTLWMGHSKSLVASLQKRTVLILFAKQEPYPLSAMIVVVSGTQMQIHVDSNSIW